MGQWVIEGSLGGILFNSRIITEEDIQKALAEQERTGARFGEALVRLGIVTTEDINWALSHHLDIPYIRLNRDELDPDAAASVPEQVARRHLVVPVIRTGDELRIALVDPLDRDAIREIQSIGNCSVSISIADERDIREMIDYLYGPEELGAFEFASELASADEIAAISADPTGGRFLEWLLSLLEMGGFSSITVLPVTGGVMISGYCGGCVREVGRLNATDFGRFSALLRDRSCPVNLPGGISRGSLGHPLDNGELKFRVNRLNGADGEVITIKPSEKSRNIPFPTELAIRIRELAANAGLMLLVLPDGVTLQLMELLLDDQAFGRRRGLVLGHGNGKIRERLPCIPINLCSPEVAAGVVAESLEHRPELLIIERAADAGILVAAARAALGGVSVLAGSGAGISETLSLMSTTWRRHHAIPAALRGMVVGAVVPLLCPSCREPLHLSAEEVALLRLPPAVAGYRHGRGCNACGFTGEGEVQFLSEVIPCDSMVAELFETCADSGEIMENLVKRGVFTLQEKAARLLQAGDISPETYHGLVMS